MRHITAGNCTTKFGQGSEMMEPRSSLLLLIATTTVLAGQWMTATGSVTHHKTIVPSPTTICSSPTCLTWDECLGNTSLCFGSYTDISILPGEYILHSPIIVEGVESLTIRGTAREGGDNLRRNLVTIDCQYEDGGIAFLNVTYLVVSDITVMQCGFRGGANSPIMKYSVHDVVSYYIRYFELWRAALYAIKTFNVHLEGVIIRDSYQSGLVCINCLGNSSIETSVITRSNYRLIEYKHHFGCTIAKCWGKNLWVIFTSTKSRFTSDHFFTIEDTEISYGVDLVPNQVGALTHGGGMTVEASQWNYFVHLAILNSNFKGNIGVEGCHLGILITYTHLVRVLVRDTIFSLANRVNGSDLTEPVQAALHCTRHGSIAILVHDPLGFSYASYFRKCQMIFLDLSNITIVSNFGRILTLVVKDGSSLCQVVVRVESSLITNNGVCHDNTAKSFYGGMLLLMGTFKEIQALVVLLNNVEMSHNFIAFDQHELYTSDPLPLMVLETVTMHLTSTSFINNSITPLSAFVSELHFYGQNTFVDNTGVCGGALSLNDQTIMFLYPAADILIANNTALTYGGGICIDSGQVPTTTYNIQSCQYELPILHALVNDDDILNFPKIQFQYNTAAITGHDVYGWFVPCDSTKGSFLLYYATHAPNSALVPVTKGIQLFIQNYIIHSQSLNNTDNYQFSSKPVTVRFCSDHNDDFAWDIHTITRTLYPGETIQVRAVGIGSTGVSQGIIPVDVHSSIDQSHVKMSIAPEVQSLPNWCDFLNYMLLAPEGLTGIIVSMSVEDYRQTIDIQLNLSTLFCPEGFAFDSSTSSCVCSSIFARASVQCKIDTQTFIRSDSVWVGVDSFGVLLAHMHCPSTYCKAELTEFTLSDRDAQCASNHSGVLCGGCQEGYALVLGSPKCQQCSNAYLSLILVFAVLGILLVLCLSKLDITVANGAINGFLFYANVVKVSSDAFTTFPSILKFFLIPLAWLNVDLGIEVCFSSHMDMFWKAMLQFVFPLYIWLLVAGIILVSRYSPLAARLSGSNSVPVLATLFLLSYAKVLDTIITTFSFTFIATERGRPLVVWLHNGNLMFLQGKHIALFLVSTLFAIVYIIPLTLILLFSPVLQRLSYWWVVRLVQKVKPLLDAYQGPYKDRFRWWPGLMLGVRAVLFIALTANTAHDPKLSTFIVVLVTFILLLAKLFLGGYVYRHKLLSFLENILLGNLLVFGLWSLLNHSTYSTSTSEFSNHQAGAVYTSISITYILLTAVILHRVYKKMVDCGVEQFVLRVIRRGGDAVDEPGVDQEVELRERQGSGYAPVGPPPTVTFVELREPLLTDN